jgi:hypothetical protein
MSNRSLEDLVREYRSGTLNEREKAEYEQAIYTQATMEKAREPGEDRVAFLYRALGVPKYESVNRQALLTRGDNVDLLWERVMRDSLPVTSAVHFARQAQTICYNEHIAFPEALKRVLDEYDARPGVTALKSGKIVKKSAPNRLRKLEVKMKPEAKTSPKLPAAPTVPLLEEPPVAKNARDTWRVIRQITENMLNERMAGCDPVFIETMLRDFRHDLEALIESYQSRINRVGAAHRGETLLPVENQKDEINDACRELSLDEIENIGDVIDIIQARKNARSFLAKFHPDKNPGKEKLFTTKYRAVQEALTTLETYNDVHGVKANAGSN